ncbi:MAG: hypothetical protein QW239_06670, partial [Metallosphaera sp.]
MSIILCIHTAIMIDFIIYIRRLYAMGKTDDLEEIARRFPFKYVEVRHQEIRSRVISLMNGELLGVYE